MATDENEALTHLAPTSSGRVTIPTEAFHAVLGGQEVKRKGGSSSSSSDKKKKN